MALIELFDKDKVCRLVRLKSQSLETLVSRLLSSSLELLNYAKERKGERERDESVSEMFR